MLLLTETAWALPSGEGREDTSIQALETPTLNISVEAVLSVPLSDNSSLIFNNNVEIDKIPPVLCLTNPPVTRRTNLLSSL